MGTLHAALAWAQRGFAVFPLQENSREPALPGDWNSIATTDAEVIRSLWVDPVLGTERNYNIGCACTGMVVVDIDVKKGKNGYAEYIEMQGHFDTLVVRTTSGGFHCYFHGPDSTNAPLAGAVDVRSHRGYVVAPGSTIEGSPYEVINDRDMAWVPLAIESRLESAYSRKDANPDAVVDSEASVAGAIRFLESAPPAVEGQRGDETTFMTACRLVREFALSSSTAFYLMRDYYNPRCVPPWDLDALWLKVQNAESYGSADMGLLTPELLFAGVQVEPPPSVFASLAWGNMIAADRVRPRPWLVDRMLMKQAVTLILASGSAGKSSLALALAAHLAVGKDFAGFKVHATCKTIVYNGEDDIEEQSRRLQALCGLYGLDLQAVKAQIMFVSARDFKIQVVVRGERNRAEANAVIVNQLIELAKDPEVGCIIADPLVKLHQCNESDNVEMDVVMETLTRVAQEADIALAVLHHSSKGSDRQEDRIGNMDIARGASAIVNAARIAFTLLNASTQDQIDYGIPAAEAHMYARLDDAKMNLSLAGRAATWFKRESVRIYSGDNVGVMKHTVLSKSKEHIKVAVADVVLDGMIYASSATLSLASAVSLCRDKIPQWQNKTPTEVRREIEMLFSTPLTRRDKPLSLVREGKDLADIKFTVAG